MKRLLPIVLVCLGAGNLVAADLVEAIVARVGDRIITRSQYERRLDDTLAQIEANAPPAEVAARKETIRKELLNEMLSELLLKDRADRLGITVAPAEIQDAIGRLKEQYGITSDAEFDESLRKSGLSRAEMENRLRDTLLTNKVFSRELRSRSDLTDRELRERYDREKEDYRLPERARLRELVVVIPDGASAETVSELRSRAGAIAERARGGEDFTALVNEYSGSPSKEKGGDIGTVARGELIRQLDEPVFQAPAGSVVGPIETKYGFHLLLVAERLPSEIPNFDAVKAQLRKDASEETFQRDYTAYIEKLRQDAFIQLFEENL